MFTGAGTFYSEAGDFPNQLNIKGIVNFSFNAGYANNKLLMSAAIIFPSSNLTFDLTSPQWIVINNTEAVMLGSGIYNGASGYNVLISGISGNMSDANGSNKLRIRITDKNNNVIYDNQLGTPINQLPNQTISGNINISE